ncbi:NAD(P)-binding domain-containing protein, partial [Salinisphaera sp. USBA-960]|nr:NAD(P)-binding domain-containing protein [Salifodinibacter halophilus]
MRIALLGGTGDIGEGLALRWAYDTDHEILIGSRDPEKARAKAEEYETELDSRGLERT